jgi:hypothetical protein
MGHLQPVFRDPSALIPRREPQRNTIAEELAIDQADDDADPVHEGEGRIVCDGEAIDTTRLALWRLQPDGREGIEGDIKAKADAVKEGDDDQDRRDGNLERIERDSDLCRAALVINYRTGRVNRLDNIPSRQEFSSAQPSARRRTSRTGL